MRLGGFPYGVDRFHLRSRQSGYTKADFRQPREDFRRKCWSALAESPPSVLGQNIVSIAQTSRALRVQPSLLLTLLTVSAGPAFAQGEKTEDSAAVDAPDAPTPDGSPSEPTGAEPPPVAEDSSPNQELESGPQEIPGEAGEAGEAPPDQANEAQQDVAPALEGGQTEPPPTAKPTVPESSPDETQLVTRPSEQSAKKASNRPLYLAPPNKILIAEQPTNDEVDPREEMPGDVVARPLTLPRGTFAFAFGLGSVFAGGQSKTANAPDFGLGITDAIELGLSAPLRYDQGTEAWSPLEPTPYLAITWEQREAFEYGTEVSVVIPTLGETDTQLNIAVPVLFRLHPRWRLDAAIEAQLGFESDTQVSIRVPVLARAQLLPALFLGVGAAADIGVTSGRDTGADLRALVGTTYQSRGRAHAELTGEFFIENMGGGQGDQLSDGAGFLLQVGFFPQLY